MDHLPVFLQLNHRPCLVVGGGVVAERKVRLLMRAGAAVTVIAQDLTDELARLRDENGIVQHDGEFADRLLAGMRLVIAATDDEEVNRQVSRAAEDAGILCNVVDDGAASSFIVPAIVDRSPVVVAIGTSGNAPVLAQRLKSQIEAWLPTRIDALATQAGRWRELVRKRFSTVRERRRFWQRFFDGPIAEHLLANRKQEAERALRMELIENVVPHSPQVGEAYIVGAGPGDPGLVTIRAQQLISHADVVVYDRLVSEKILDFARKDAQLVYVGKTANRVTISQNEINELMVAYVRKGRRVCRLKGGDPFVFGRGGEEVQALADAGLPFQVVPGISAALGCAAYAGIPLTHRGLSSSVTFATAKLDGDQAPDWSTLAQPGQTLVLYMSVGSVAETAEQLIEHGIAAKTPVAIVENGTTDQQRVLRGTLATIANDAVEAHIRAPAVIIVGATAGMGEELGWFAANPNSSGPRSNRVLSRHRDLPYSYSSSVAR
ncbi:MAG: uroporphyrinogen-III C-methyltransferase [Proteobacteria bacterium]|nr:uroporphyrinogen-III C-methyltransferase [Pseudomonadota bacterium]